MVFVDLGGNRGDVSLPESVYVFKLEITSYDGSKVIATSFKTLAVYLEIKTTTPIINPSLSLYSCGFGRMDLWFQ